MRDKTWGEFDDTQDEAVRAEAFDDDLYEEPSDDAIIVFPVGKDGLTY